MIAKNLLWEEYARSGSDELRNQIFEHYSWLVGRNLRGIDYRLREWGVDEGDEFNHQQGRYALLDLVDEFNFERGGGNFEAFVNTRLWKRVLDNVVKEFKLRVTTRPKFTHQYPEQLEARNYWQDEIDLKEDLRTVSAPLSDKQRTVLSLLYQGFERKDVARMFGNTRELVDGMLRKKAHPLLRARLIDYVRNF